MTVASIVWRVPLLTASILTAMQSYDGADVETVRSRFNRAEGKYRLVLLASPT